MRTPAATIELPDRFRLADHVADGGMASVWAAEDRVLRRMVAIKLLAARFLGDQDAVRRFQREARAAASVSTHPHVVTIFDVGEHGGQPFIVMEYMAGGSLADALRGPAPPREEVRRWLHEAAAALDFAHDRGLVHRDVKPANLLLDGRRRLGVTDFGIARVASDATVTATGQVMGTAAYLSPEQAAGEPAGPASDRYALALVAYELLTGERPYLGGSPAAQARQHLEADPLPPSARAANDLPPAVDGVLMRGLEKDPDARWTTAGELVEALDAALQGDDADPATARLPATTDTIALPPRRQARRGVPVARGRSRWAVPALVVAGLLMALIALAALGGGERRPLPRGASAPPPRTAPAAERDASTPAPAPDRGSVSALNDRGFALIRAGRYDDAIPILRRAVQKCGRSSEPVCAFALFNLGHALRLAGRPAEAIPILERRLQIPNQRDVVARELELARQEAGQTSGGDDEREGDDDGNRAGHGKHKRKHRKGD